jgi:YHS domain-containing protein
LREQFCHIEQAIDRSPGLLTLSREVTLIPKLEGKTYCFGSKEAMAEFMKNPKENLAKAQTYYSKKHPG